MSQQAERQALRLCVNGRKKDRHGVRAQDERGVSIWAESRMHLKKNVDRAQKPNLWLKEIQEANL